jgi:hypothetical protein
MFSTLDGAKLCAKQLKRVFETSGFIYPLHKCQAAIARGAGFRDWHDLDASLTASARAVDPSAFRKRLIAALPEPCRVPALAWLDRDPEEKTIDPDTPPRWYRDTFPYLMAFAVLHGSRTALLRPGSGRGQRLRERMVLGLLLNTRGAHGMMPQFEPDTPAFAFKGQPTSLFGDDATHADFDDALAALTGAGVLEIGDNLIRVFAPDGAALAEYITKQRTGRAEHFLESQNPEAAFAIQDALAAIGVRNARRVANAILRFNSEAYTVPSGAMLDLLSDLAAQGEMETFARACAVLGAIHPASAQQLHNAVPAKVSSQFLSVHRQLTGQRIVAWASQHPEWPETLKAALGKPALFAATADAMADAIAGST